MMILQLSPAVLAGVLCVCYVMIAIKHVFVVHQRRQMNEIIILFDVYSAKTLRLYRPLIYNRYLYCLTNLLYNTFTIGEKIFIKLKLKGDAKLLNIWGKINSIIYKSTRWISIKFTSPLDQSIIIYDKCLGILIATVGLPLYAMFQFPWQQNISIKHNYDRQTRINIHSLYEISYIP